MPVVCAEPSDKRGKCGEEGAGESAGGGCSSNKLLHHTASVRVKIVREDLLKVGEKAELVSGSDKRRKPRSVCLIREDEERLSRCEPARERCCPGLRSESYGDILKLPAADVYCRVRGATDASDNLPGGTDNVVRVTQAISSKTLVVGVGWSVCK